MSLDYTTLEYEPKELKGRFPRKSRPGDPQEVVHDMLKTGIPRYAERNESLKPQEVHEQRGGAGQ